MRSRSEPNVAFRAPICRPAYICPTEGTGHDLHRLTVTAVAAYIGNVAAPVHHHPVPLEQPISCDGFKGMAVEIGHHLRDTGLRWSAAQSRGRHSELAAERRLHAVTVENFPLDRGCAQCVGAQELDHEFRMIAPVEMTHAPRDPPGGHWGNAVGRERELAWATSDACKFPWSRKCLSNIMRVSSALVIAL